MTSSWNGSRNARSLHIRHFPVDESNLNVLVDVNLLGTKIDDLVRVADRGFYLLGGLPLFNLRGLRRRCLLLLCLSLSRTLIVALLVVIIAALQSSALLAGAIIEREQAGDRIFYL